MKPSPKDPAAARQYFEGKMSFTTGPVELSKTMHDDAVAVVDVRATEDFAREHIPGSINLPESEWANASAHGLSKDRTNVLLCSSYECHLAARAAIELAGQGYPVMELEGGFDGWKNKSLPVESEGGGGEAVDRARAFLADARAAQAKSGGAPAESKQAKPEEEASAAPASEPPDDQAKTDEAKPAAASTSGEDPAKSKGDAPKADAPKADAPKADESAASETKAALAAASKPADEAEKDDGNGEGSPEKLQVGRLKPKKGPRSGAPA